MLQTLKFTFALLICNALGLIALVALAEVGLAKMYQSPEHWPTFVLEAAREYHLRLERRTLHFKTDCFAHDPLLSYLPIPGSCRYSSREFDVEMRINSAHLRDSEQDLSAPSIIALGDSHTMGWGVGEQETYGQHLQDSLDMTLLNAGVSSYGTARQAMLLRQLDYSELKLLIWQYSDNDTKENFPYLWNKFRLNNMTEERYREISLNEFRFITQSPPRLNFLRRFAPLLKQHWGTRNRQEKSLDQQQANNKQEAWAFVEILNHNANMLRNVPIIVFEVNSHNRNDSLFVDAVADELIRRRLAGKEVQIRLHLLDISQDLKDEHYFIHDDHLRPEGQAKLAALLQHKVSEVLSAKE